MIFLGVDIGTTRTKALLFDAEAGTRDVVARPTPVVESSEGDLRDADAVLRVVVETVGAVLARLTPAERDRVAGIGVTSLSEEVVLLDLHDTPLGPMPTWYNQQAGRQAAGRAGVDPSFSWAKLRWAFEALEDAGRAFPGATTDDVRTITTLNGYIAGRLLGAGPFSVDHSHASRTGFFDVRDARWITDVFASTGWPVSVLPDLVPTGTVVGTVDHALAQTWGIPATTAVALAGHDHFCGAYGIGARGDGEIFLSAGTSEAHCLIVDRVPEGPLPAEVGVGRFVDGERFYLHRQLPSGHLYRHWRSLLGLDRQPQEEEGAALAARPIGSRGAVLVPGEDTDNRSWLLGLPADADAPLVLRALFEGLACAALRLDRHLAELSHREVTAVIAAGLPCQSPAWQEIRGHLSAAPLAISMETEAPALGAAFLAQRAVTGVAAPAQASRPVQTDPSLLAAYRSVYERFESAAAAVIR